MFQAMYQTMEEETMQKKIVVMLSSTDPTYGYVKEDGEYDDTYITDRV